MIQRQLKLKLNKLQRQNLEQWLWHLTGVWNFAVRKIELDAADRIYHSRMNFSNLLAKHRFGPASHTVQATLNNAWTAWDRYFRKVGGKPRLKGRRRPMNSIPFPDPIKAPKDNRIRLPLLGKLRLYKQAIPEGRIKCGRIVRRASGWYLCLFIDTASQIVPRVAFGSIGIDPGFSNLLTTSNGEKIVHPRELQLKERRLAQAQRGCNRRLTSRLHERVVGQRKHRNHILSKRLVSENIRIAFSKDNHKAIARKFGKSVASSAHGQLRQMLAYKSLSGGSDYVEVPSCNSTRTCSNCGALNGPRVGQV